jgi:RimJ/RimL family protein N-acetyltransferase
MRIVDDERVIAFVGDKIGIIMHQPCTALGLEKDGEIISGFVFNNHTTYDIEVTAAVAPRSEAREFLKRVGQYVFDELKCLRMTITTHQYRVVDLAIRLGAQTEGRKRNHFGTGRDGIILGILRDDWKV